MKFVREICVVSALVLFVSLSPMLAQSAPVPQGEAILHPADLAKIVPGSVFFRGQSATTQLRNSGGVRFADGALMFAVLVDNSGYSTGIQQKYQAYFITEIPLNIEGRRLVPGAYGAGIVKTGASPQFVIQDLGAHVLLQAPAKHDAKLHRPVPLEVMKDSGAGTYRLYFGRNYVEFERGK
ncbi:MAG: hypothetical protein WBD10_07965 [Acidobacteriaceae bacterium]